MSVASLPTVLAGRYRLEREIGRGGMGAVYLARDLKHDSRVAVKLLGEGFGSTGAVDRFLAEIRTTAQLNHPHILTVHDSGEAGGELYYVMPHVQGASLRERLEREGRLPIGEALRIACQVASALSYAHAHGVIHRDIKPDNILLDPRGHPYVMDFGLARALSSVTAGHVTARGIAVGSPHYMSPEQAAGETVDGRSDIYALGCMLFEMLAGQPPFQGPNAQAVLHRHLTEPAPALKARRADIPDALERIVRTALAKQPDDRQVSADQLVRELEAILDTVSGRAKTEARPQSLPSYRRRSAIAAAVLVVGVGALLWALRLDTARSWLGGAPPDSTRLLVLPLQWTEGSRPSPDGTEDRLLYSAFDRWVDLDLVARPTVAAEIGQNGLVAGIGGDLARRFDAGRFVQGLATRVGDSVHIDLTMSDAENDARPIARMSARVPADGSAPAHYALAADSLLFGRVTWSDGPEWDIGTSSAAARRAYGRAHAALADWEVERADSLFAAAIGHDESFARAHLWRAQLGAWRGIQRDVWLTSARGASARSDDLDSRERLLAAALVALEDERYPEACVLYDSLAHRDPRDFAAWFGIGECSVRDHRVVRDRTSPSGWRFRASYHRGVEAFRRAFELEAGSRRLVRASAFARLYDQILFTRENRRRDGRSEDGRTFSTQPQWVDDTLALVPVPWNAGDARPDRRLRGTEAALLAHRAIFRDIARAWAANDPNDPGALHAVAAALALQGDAAALDTLLRARRLTKSESDLLELSISEVWLRVKLSTLRDVDLSVARVLADSVLRSPTARREIRAERLAALAILVGRPTAAARFARRDGPDVNGSSLPTSITRSGAALLVFAAAGAPVDSIAALEAIVEAAIRNGLPPEQRDEVRMSVLLQPAMLAYPGHVSRLLNSGRAPVAVAQAALLRRDTAAALDALQPYRDHPGGTLDMTFAGALVAALSGDTATAIANLDAATDIAWVQPGMIERPHHTGALVRAMALRAELASAAGDRETARRWARSVIALWGNGERSVQGVVRRMRELL